MIFRLCLVVGLMFATAHAPGAVQEGGRRPAAKSARVVHVVVVNLSGKEREARVRGAVIPLRVAERVALRVVAGDRVTITSSTQRGLEQVLEITAKDDGRTIPVL